MVRSRPRGVDAGRPVTRPAMPCSTLYAPVRSRFVTASTGDDDDDSDELPTIDEPMEETESDFEDFDDDFDDDFEEEPDDPDWDHPDDEPAEPPPAKKK
jgi:hypothetical protein